MRRILFIALAIFAILLIFSACGLNEDPRISLAKKYIQAISEGNVSVAATYIAGRDSSEEAEFDALTFPSCNFSSLTFQIGTNPNGEIIEVYYETTRIRSIYFVEINGQLYIETSSGGWRYTDVCDSSFEGTSETFNIPGETPSDLIFDSVEGLSCKKYGRIFLKGSHREEPLQIYSICPDGSELTQLTNVDNLDIRNTVVISPNGKKIIFTVGSINEKIMIMNADGSDLHQLVNSQTMKQITEDSWSPDSKKIVFKDLDGGNKRSDIWIVNSDGQHLEKLTEGFGKLVGPPTWSPDNKYIYFSGSNWDSNYSLYQLEIDSQKIDKLYDGPINPGAIDIDNSGEIICFFNNSGSHFSMNIAEADKTEIHETTPGFVNSPENPCWKRVFSYDHKYTVDVSSSKIYIHSSEIRGAVPITDDEYEFLNWVTWQPNP